MGAPSAPPAAGDPYCPHAPDCAGCALIGTAYTQQLAIKRDKVVAALGAYARLAGVPTAQSAARRASSAIATR
jgi:tRNA/tmRNA/rRNA uracil-C5-methylase (TrmA/RlmC/RlmD family)